MSGELTGDISVIIPLLFIGFFIYNVSWQTFYYILCLLGFYTSTKSTQQRFKIYYLYQNN